MSSKTSVAQVSEEGNGFACILPARQGSQIGSGFAKEFIVKPVTRFCLCIFLILSWFKCPSRLCQRVRSRGRVETNCTFSEISIVEPVGLCNLSHVCGCDVT